MDSQASMRRRSIVVSGPLAQFTDGLRRDAAGRGYAVDTIVDHVHLLADLSQWLDSPGLTAAELTSLALGGFLSDRRAGGCRTGLTLRGLAPVVDYLRRIDVAPPVVERVTVATLLDSVLSDYERHLARVNAGGPRPRFGTTCVARIGSRPRCPNRWGCRYRP